MLHLALEGYLSNQRHKRSWELKSIKCKLKASHALKKKKKKKVLCKAWNSQNRLASIIVFILFPTICKPEYWFLRAFECFELPKNVKFSSNFITPNCGGRHRMQGRDLDHFDSLPVTPFWQINWHSLSCYIYIYVFIFPHR